MKKTNSTTNAKSSKGARLFKKMIEEKQAIQKHLAEGKKIEELKDKFRFVKPLSTLRK